MSDYFDDLECRSADQRREKLAKRLAEQVQIASTKASAYTDLYHDIELGKINALEDLTRLPVIRKSELVERQRQHRPFGGYNITSIRDVSKVFASPGPIYEPEGRRNDYWRMGRAMHAAGFRRGDLVHNTFSYHFTPAGSMMETGAHAIGCPVFPAGTGQTELQVAAISDLKPRCYAGTPSFLKIILDKALEMDVEADSLKVGLVSGEALPPSLRRLLGERGVDVLQCYATADLGLIAYESPVKEGMIIDEEVYVEIVKPGTGEPCPDGEVGEVLVTNFNKDYPLIRFATGDLSAILEGDSPCGRTNRRIKGWMGRADQTTKVRGMFVHPGQVAQVINSYKEIGKARLIVDREDVNDNMLLRCETAKASEGLKKKLVQRIREICKLRGDVEFVEPGSLPNDGKVIDDIRTYD